MTTPITANRARGYAIIINSWFFRNFLLMVIHEAFTSGPFVPNPISYFLTLDSWTLTLVSNPCWGIGCLLYHQSQAFALGLALVLLSIRAYGIVALFSQSTRILKSPWELCLPELRSHATRKMTHSCFSWALVSSFHQGTLDVSTVHVVFFRNTRLV